MDKKALRIDISITIFYILLLLSISLLMMLKRNTPYYSDEIGYWAAGAWIDGIDWSPIMSYSPYYGWGYGILLAPFLLISNSILRFRLALALNSLMLVGSFFILYRILLAISKANSSHDRRNCIIVAGTVTCYTYNLAFSNTTMCETFLMFLFLLQVLAMSYFLRKPSFLMLLLVAIIMLFQLATHLRTLVICLALFCSLTVLTITKRINSRYLIVWVLLCAGVVFLTFHVKDIVILQQYTHENTEIIRDTGNDSVMSRVSILRYMFYKNFITHFGSSLVGKTLYIVCASFSMIYWGIKKILSDMISAKARRAENSEETNDQCRIIGIELFVLLSFILSFGESVVTLQYGSRYDQVFYGRYFDNVSTIIIALGILDTIYRKKIREIVFIASGVLLSAKYLYVLLDPKLYHGNLLLESAWPSGFFHEGENDPRFIYTLLMSIASLGIVFLIFSLKNFRHRCLLMAVLWSLSAINGTERCIENELDRMEATIEAVEAVRENNELYTIVDPRNIDVFVDALWLQFHAGKKTIQVVEEDDIQTLDSYVVLLVSKKYKNCKAIAQRMDIVQENNEFYILTNN